MAKVFTHRHARWAVAQDPSPLVAALHASPAQYRLRQTQCTSTGTKQDFLHSNQNTHAVTFQFHFSKTAETPRSHSARPAIQSLESEIDRPSRLLSSARRKILMRRPV